MLAASIQARITRQAERDAETDAQQGCALDGGGRASVTHGGNGIPPY